MIHHVVCWNFRPELSKEEQAEAGKQIQKRLTDLVGQIDGIIELKVYVNEYESSNRDIALISVFDSIESLNQYQVHPKHLEAGAYIKSVVCDRVCFDY